MTLFESLLAVAYLVGYLLAIGYQFRMVSYYNRSDGLLNKVAVSILSGFLSWILIGSAIYYKSTNRKPVRKKKIIKKPKEEL